MQSNQVTPSTPSFEVAANGYLPDAVDTSLARLVAELTALHTRASALEVEVGLAEAGSAGLAGEAAMLAALDTAEATLRQAYAEARAATAQAATEAERARATAKAEVAADLHRLDVEIGEVHEVAVESAARMLDLARMRATEYLEREELTVERAGEWAELIVVRARTNATGFATRTVQTLTDEQERLLDRRAIEAERRRAFEEELATLRAQTRRISTDADHELAGIRSAAAAQAAELVAEAAGAAARVEAETDLAMAELTEAMAQLKAELTNMRTEPAKPARAARTRTATKTEAKPRTTRARKVSEPDSEAQPVEAKAPARTRAAKPPAPKPTPKPAGTEPAADRRVQLPTPAAAAAPIAVAPAPVPVPQIPARVALSVAATAPLQPVPDLPSVTPVAARAVPVVVTSTTRAVAPKPQPEQAPGFVRLTPAPGVPTRRIVPAALPANATMIARRVRRLANAPETAPVEAPKPTTPALGGPSCLAGTTTAAQVTVLRPTRQQS